MNFTSRLYAYKNHTRVTVVVSGGWSKYLEPWTACPGGDTGVGPVDGDLGEAQDGFQAWQFAFPFVLFEMD